MEQRIILDPAGFPLLDLPEVGFAIHWFPVTKIQVEYFLSVVNDTRYDENWYTSLLNFLPRISPGSIRPSNYWQSFITGILPAEAQRFSQWCGRGFDLPTASEWIHAYHYLHQFPASPDNIAAVFEHSPAANGIQERTERLINAVERASANEDHHLGEARTLADQMLMRLGVMEYVYEDEQRDTFGGLGISHPGLLPTFREAESLQSLTNRHEGLRLKQYGFRLIKRKGL